MLFASNTIDPVAPIKAYVLAELSPHLYVPS
jgi:hypothetical protein